jgi:hypothetical protein
MKLDVELKAFRVDSSIIYDFIFEGCFTSVAHQLILPRTTSMKWMSMMMLVCSVNAFVLNGSSVPDTLAPVSVVQPPFMLFGFEFAARATISRQMYDTALCLRRLLFSSSPTSLQVG